MDYFSLLDLQKEPFSNSPDPEFFFGSDQHITCLQQLELAIRLRRGLSVVIGDIGTGKTTLCRQLIRRLDRSGEGGETIGAYLLLDPEFGSGRELLLTLVEMLGLEPLSASATDRQIKEALEHFLFEQGVTKQRMTVLIIDEGQRLPGFCLEILRELLNYETNQYKLLQIVIFAQQEFDAALTSLVEEYSPSATAFRMLSAMGDGNATLSRSISAMCPPAGRVADY